MTRLRGTQGAATILPLAPWLLLSDWMMVSLMTSNAVLGCAVKDEDEEAAEVTTATLETGVTDSSVQIIYFHKSR